MGKIIYDLALNLAFISAVAWLIDVPAWYLLSVAIAYIACAIGLQQLMNR